MATPVRRAFLTSANLKTDPRRAAYEARAAAANPRTVSGTPPEDDESQDFDERRSAYESRAAAKNPPSLTPVRPAPPPAAGLGAGIAGSAPVGSTPSTPDITNMQDAGLQPDGSRDLLAYGAANGIPRPAQTEAHNPMSGDTNAVPGGGTTQPLAPGAAAFSNPGSESIYKSFARRISRASNSTGNRPRTNLRSSYRRAVA